ncbi:MAG: HDIG domain-containing protein [Chloroflexi bacterium]|nr:HDIG domain-containing protein [Chloroflexota bacterium]
MIAGDPALRRTSALTRWQGSAALVLGALTALALALIFVYQPTQTNLRLEVGQVGLHTLLAPERVTFVSEIQTREARLKAERDAREIFDPPDAKLARDQVRLATQIFDHLDSVRQDPYTTSVNKLAWLNAIPSVRVPNLTISRTLLLEDNAYRRVVTEILYVLDVTMRDEIRPRELPTHTTRLASRVSLALPAEQADLVTQWAKSFVVPNTFFNPQKTEEQRALARDRVGTVYRSLEKGEAIVREGQIVTPLAYEALDAVGLLAQNRALTDYAGPVLIACALIALLGIYLARLRLALFTRPRAVALVAFIILAFALGARVVAPSPTLLNLYPLSAAAMLLAVLLDAPIALGASFVLALTAGFFAPDPFPSVVYALAGCMIAALSLGRIERLQAFLWSGTYVALMNAVISAAFQITARDASWATVSQAILIALGNGALSGLIAFGSLFVLGKLFGITTPLELLDLSRPTHPLLQKLLIEAPGTYHHSLIVGHLAEQAAHRVGADALLVRVGAYYHDVGKTYASPSFVENQLDGVNIHDTLTPTASASVVIEHVQRGITLARRYKLPERLIEFIPQHHGTTLAAYFHRKAMRANGDVPIVEKDFRYPGPKPQSREAAILMLADGVEATTRAERPGSLDQIRAIIDRIVNERLRDGQLDECELTLRDLEQIKVAFTGVLQGLFHPRVKYPDPPPENVEQTLDRA